MSQPLPVENAIRLLEANKTHDEIREIWGQEVLTEALSFHEIPSVEEYMETLGIV